METERVDAAEKKVTGRNLTSKEQGPTAPCTTTLPVPCSSAAKKDVQDHGNMDLDTPPTGSSSKSWAAENMSNGCGELRQQKQGKAKEMRRERWRQK